MNAIKACRICLNTNVKAYHMETFQLKSYYEEVMNCMVPENDNLLQFICYQCGALLAKYNAFRSLCIKSQEVLRGIWMQNWDISLVDVLNIEKYRNSLCLSIDHMIKTNRLGIFQYIQNEDKKLDIYIFKGDNTLKETSLKEKHNDCTIDVLREPDTLGDCQSLYSCEDAIDKGNCELYPGLNVYNEEISKEITYKKRLKKNKHSLENLDFCRQSACIDDSLMKGNGSLYRKLKKHNSLIDGREGKYRKKEDKDFPEKVKFAKQKASGYKFDTNKWKIVTLSEEETFREFNAKATNPSFKSIEFVCTKCLKGFSNQNTLDRHMTVHSEARGKHECYLCKRRFKWETKLRAHLKTHQVRYHCLRCSGVYVTSSQAIFHERYHDGVIYECKLCDANFTKASTYYTHVRMMHRSRHVCSVCGASFVSESGLNQHTKYVHKTEIMLRKQAETAKLDSETYCHKCDITFETQQAYEEHTRNSTLHVDDQDCDFNNSGTKSKLLKPGREVHKSTPATCDQCGDRFATERACARHKRRVHETPTRTSGRYICEICGASISPCSIFQHQNTHTRAHVYPCATCGKVFKTPANRSRHLVTHTGEKPFACRLCDKRFTQRNSVKLHVRTYHQKQPYPVRDRRRKKPDLKYDQVQ